MNRHQLRIYISELFIKWGMGTRQVVIGEILSLINNQEKEVRNKIKIELAQLDWIKILDEAIKARKTSWGNDPVIEYRNASDELYNALMRQAKEKGFFEDWLKKGVVAVAKNKNIRRREKKKKPKKPYKK